jgi:hypothetical protein
MRDSVTESPTDFDETREKLHGAVQIPATVRITEVPMRYCVTPSVRGQFGKSPGPAVLRLTRLAFILLWDLR